MEPTQTQIKAQTPLTITHQIILILPVKPDFMSIKAQNPWLLNIFYPKLEIE